MKNQKTFLDNFNSQEEIIRLALTFLPEKYKNIVYLKYGESLSEKESNPNLTRNQVLNFYNNILNRMRNVLDFLKKENITISESKTLSSRFTSKMNKILEFLNNENLSEKEIKKILTTDPDKKYLN